jgi:hypothetical protein
VDARHGRRCDVKSVVPPRSFEVPAYRIESLEKICVWLGTYRERLRVARDHERPEVSAVVSELDALYKQRRAELA